MRTRPVRAPRAPHVKRRHGGAGKPRAKTDSADSESAQFLERKHRDSLEAHQHVDRPGDRGAYGANVVGACNPRRIEHRSPGGFKGLQSADRVVEVGTAVQKVLGARHEHEREGKSAVAAARPQPAHGMVEL